MSAYLLARESVRIQDHAMLKGKSRARAQDKFPQPRDQPETQPAASEEDVGQTTTKRRKRHASVYDAVAGRVGLNGFITNKHAGNGVQDPGLRSANIKPLTPEEVLLRRVHAPTHAPLGYYAADQALPPERRLPDYDLLKAVHAYASDFYSSTATTAFDGPGCDFRSMNETALLAVGIMLEEAAIQVLGEAGDMVLVEPEGLEEGLPEERSIRYQVKGRVRPVATPEPEEESEEDMVEKEVEQVEVRRRKRRRFNAFV